MYRVTTRAIGLLAAKTLDRARHATVLATFERSFYLDVEGELIAVVAEDLPEGPLTVCIAAATTDDLGVTIDQRWSIGPNNLNSADGLVIDIANADIWHPRPVDGGIDRSSLAQGLDTLRGHLARHPLPHEGLARLVLLNAPAKSSVERAAAPAIGRLETTLLAGFQGQVATEFENITGLIGLGPGLTPSGDDLSGGVLIAYHRLRETSTSERLGDAILASVDRTNIISRAHLRAAVLGYGAAPLHELLDAIFANDRPGIEVALDATAKIGHSSGFDALAGIILALRIFLVATSS